MDSILNDNELSELTSVPTCVHFDDANQILTDFVTKVNEIDSETILNDQLKLDFYSKISNLMNISRKLNLYTCHTKTHVAGTRGVVDDRILGYENMSYEIYHLERQIDDCLNFQCNIDDLNLEDSADCGDEVVDQHSLTVNKLKYEIKRRLGLKEQVKRLESEKAEIVESIKSTKCKMDALTDAIPKYLQSLSILDTHLGPLAPTISLETSHVHLSPILYSLYYNLTCQTQRSQNFSTKIESSKSICEQSGTSLDLLSIIQPYCVVLSVTIDQFVVDLVFWATKSVDLIGTKVCLTFNGVICDNLFDPPNLFDNIIDGDCGDLPADSVLYRGLMTIRFSGGFDELYRSLGRYYAWGLWLANSTCLFSDSHKLARTRSLFKSTVAETVLSEISARLYHRIALNSFIIGVNGDANILNNVPNVGVKITSIGCVEFVEKTGFSDCHICFKIEISLEKDSFVCYVDVPDDYSNSLCGFIVPEQDLLSFSTARAISADVSVGVVNESESSLIFETQLCCLISYLSNVVKNKQTGLVEWRDRVTHFKRSKL